MKRNLMTFVAMFAVTGWLCAQVPDLSGCVTTGTKGNLANTATLVTGVDTSKMATAISGYVGSKVAYAYSPTNKPSAADIGAATLADVSAAMATNALVTTQQLDLALSAIQPSGSESALRLASTDSNWWVSVESGTATLWRVQREHGWQLSVPTPGITASITNLPAPALWLTYPYSPDNYSFAAYGYQLDIYKSGDTHTFSLYDGNGDYYETSGVCVDGSETDGVAVSNIIIYSTHELPNATLTYLGDGPRTNSVGRYIDDAALAAALASYASPEAATALSVASNALELANSAIDLAATNVFPSILLSSPLTNALLRLTWDPTNQTVLAQEILP